MIAGVPFYTRLWFERPKTDEEFAADEGTEAENYPNKTKQNYAQWEGDGGVYKIWLEDTQSLEEKLKVIKENQLAGVAEWSLGMEGSGVWDLILQYVN